MDLENEVICAFWGNAAIVKSFYLTDIIILVCYSLSLFTQYIRLLISRFGVRIPAGAPAIPKDYRDLPIS